MVRRRQKQIDSVRKANEGAEKLQVKLDETPTGATASMESLREEWRARQDSNLRPPA